MEQEHLIHTIPPLYDSRSRILILGSFPSVKSREEGFFYGHKQNRFWRVLSAVMNCPCPAAVEEKKSFLHANGIALWDVIASCDITGSGDSTIKNAVPNDISVILKNAPIERIFTNGGKAASMYKRYQQKAVGREAVALPSTSPANAAWSLERLTAVWREKILG